MSPHDAPYSAKSHFERIKKSPRWEDNEGVAATVGTIMSLLVFLTFMGIFTTQFVPVWMSDNESTHMSEAIGQFANLKSQMDISISNYPNSLIAPSPIFVPIGLSAPGIPIFAASTAGVLQMKPDITGELPTFDLRYTWEAENGGIYELDETNDGHAGGSLSLYCPNRYYVEQTVVYEAGAVILNQTDGEYVIAGPQFSIADIGSGTAQGRVVKITQVTLEGDNRTIGGTGSKGVNADLRYASTTAYENPNGSDLVMTVTTYHGWGWMNYFNTTLESSGLEYSTDFEIHYTYVEMEDDRDNYYVVVLTIFAVGILDHTYATVDMSVGELGIL